jgi:hypothetical protein
MTCFTLRSKHYGCSNAGDSGLSKCHLCDVHGAVFMYITNIYAFLINMSLHGAVSEFLFRILLNLNGVNQLIFVMVKVGVLFEVRTGFLNNI